MAQESVVFEKTAYAGWQNCWRLSNGLVDLVVTGDVGPRVIRFGFTGGPNQFHEFKDEVGRTGDAEWLNYGGHRLWHAPENRPRTYIPDNGPVTVERQGEWVSAFRGVESTTEIQKEVRLRLHPGAARVSLVHRLTNRGPWPVQLAPWALTVLPAGSRSIIPMPPRGPHPKFLVPTNTLTLWAFTELGDPRWRLGTKYIVLSQDSGAKAPQKIGAWVPAGWIAGWRDGHLFVVRTRFDPKAAYPDMGSSMETYTDKNMLEVETLGPLVLLGPGETVEHIEEWSLHRGVAAPQDDKAIDEAVLPLVAAEAAVLA